MKSNAFNIPEEKIDDIFNFNKRVEFTEEEKKELFKCLYNIKVLDPACGSGAFPIGVLQRILYLIEKYDEDNKYYSSHINIENGERYSYSYKLNILKNNIYGVDIQPIAIEISRLRAFLTLIIDEAKADKKLKNLGVKALPNLDFRFICANSLKSLEFDIEDGTMDNYNINVINGVKEKMNNIAKLFFSASTPEEKENARYRFLEFQSIVKNIELVNEKIREKILSWNPFENHTAEFFSPVIQFGSVDNFNIVIGNPPYGAKITKYEKKYFENNYITAKTIKNSYENLKGSTDTFSLFIEKGLSLINKGVLIYITPMSIVSSESMESMHKFFNKQCELIKISNYSVRPKPIFLNAVVNVSILECLKTNTINKKVLCTKMYRKSNEDTIQDILNRLEFIDVKEFKLLGRYPKISKQIEVNILRKLFKIKNNIGSLVKDKGSPIYYRMAGGRYFKVITNYPTTKAASEKVIYFDKKIANTIGAILSSNLYFWYYQIFSDNLNMKKYEIESFKIPIDKLDNDKIKYIEKLYSKYLNDIEKNVIVHEKTNYKNITSFKEYKIRMSKNIIDEIDDFIYPLYGLTKKEIDFIKNYEIKYRIDDKED